MTSEYRFSHPLVLRFLGSFVAAVGAFVVLLALVVALASLPAPVLLVGAVLGVAAVLVVGFLLTRRWSVVRMGETGYQVHFIRGAGAKQARWTDVEDVVTTTIADEPCVVLRLRDGRTTTVPVRLLEGDARDFVRDLQQHLNRGHGYRRIS